MNLPLQIILGVLATAFFIWQYKQTKLTYQLLFAIWVPSLFLTYVSPAKTYQIALGIFQLILFALVVFFLLRAKAKQKKELKKIMEEEKAKAEQKQADAENDVETKEN